MIKGIEHNKDYDNKLRFYAMCIAIICFTIIYYYLLTTGPLLIFNLDYPQGGSLIYWLFLITLYLLINFFIVFLFIKVLFKIANFKRREI